MGDPWRGELENLHDSIERLQIERLRLIGLLEEHLSPDLVAEILDGTQKLSLGGERETVAVLFCDLRGFTRFTESASPDVVVAHLNQFFHAMTTVLFAHGATLDKFIGDSIMAYFKLRSDTPAVIARSSATKQSQGGIATAFGLAMTATTCALAMQERFAALAAQWTIGDTLGLGIGVSLGEVILGHVGSGKHVDFTVIGSPVNLASRLCAAAGSGEVLITETVAEALGLPSEWSAMPPLKVKGFDEAVKSFTNRTAG